MLCYWSATQGYEWTARR